MYNKIIINKFIEHKNSGRISKPDGIAETYSADGATHVEFSLRIEDDKIKHCQFRAQANPYIIAVCSTITELVAEKDLSDINITTDDIKKELQTDLEIDLYFCLDCLKLAIDDYIESTGKERKVKEAKISNKPNLNEILNILSVAEDKAQTEEELTEKLQEDNEAKIEQNIDKFGLGEADFIFDDDDMLDFGVDFMSLQKTDKK